METWFSETVAPPTPVRQNEFMSHPTHSARVPGRVPSRGRLEQASMKNMSTPLYQHVRSDSVPPRIKALAAGWQVWDFAQEGSGDTIHIDYDGDYGSERVLIVSGRATVIPDDGTPSFNVGPGGLATPFISCVASDAPGIFTRRR